MNSPRTRPEVMHYVGYDADGGGIVSVVRALATADRFECRLGVNPGFQQHRTPALPVVEFPALAGDTIAPRTFWRTRAVARAAAQWLRADTARVFHGHSRAGLLAALWLARSGAGRVVASAHAYGRQRWFYRWAARRLGDRLYWLSPAMKRYYGFSDPSWRQCIPGCVTPDPLTAPPTAHLRGDCVRLGGIGALVPVKRWELVVEAIAALPAAVRAKIEFRHIGGSRSDERAYAAELRRRTEVLGVAASVQWLGERSSATDFLAEIDCLVIASHEEAFAVAMLEALRAGLPVIAADGGGATDVVVDGETGWFFHHGDPRDLARILQFLAETNALTNVRIPPDAIRGFTSPVVAQQWLEVYTEILSGRH